MTDEEPREDEYETVYVVYAAPSPRDYGFGGSSSITVAVTEETEDQIIGLEYRHDWLEPYGKVVINKDNVAGWQEDHSLLERLQRTDEEWEELEEWAGVSKEELYK